MFFSLPYIISNKGKLTYLKMQGGFPGGSDGKASACNTGDPDSIPGLGRSPGEGNGKPLQYPCLENPMDRGPWQATVHGVTKSRTQLSDFPCSLAIYLKMQRSIGNKFAMKQEKKKNLSLKMNKHSSLYSAFH